MKSFNVKSNAKRVARQLAAKFPDYIADEPVAVSEGAREWFPAVAAPGKVIAAGVPEEIREVAMVNGKSLFGSDSAPIEAAPVAQVEPVAPAAPAAEAEAAPVISFSAMKAALAAVADLPKTRSTPEEIEARREARRAKAATQEPKPGKLTKAAIIIALVSRPGGATQTVLETATGWQRHTLRGYIAGTLKPRGHNIVLSKIKGEETRYLIEAATVAK